RLHSIPRLYPIQQTTSITKQTLRVPNGSNTASEAARLESLVWPHCISYRKQSILHNSKVLQLVLLQIRFRTNTILLPANATLWANETVHSLFHSSATSVPRSKSWL